MAFPETLPVSEGGNKTKKTHQLNSGKPPQTTKRQNLTETNNLGAEIFSFMNVLVFPIMDFFFFSVCMIVLQIRTAEKCLNWYRAVKLTSVSSKMQSRVVV